MIESPPKLDIPNFDSWISKFVGEINKHTWIAPTLENSWVNFSEAYNPAGYYKDILGRVHLRGMVKDGTLAQTIFTLPAGYRPAYHELMVNISNDAIGRLVVHTSGTVTQNTGNNTWVSLRRNKLYCGIGEKMEEQTAHNNVVKMEPKFEATEVTNPRYLGYIAPHINSFYEKTKIQLPTLCYETLYAYFEQSVSMANAPSEFWVVKKGDDLLAFAHWFKCGLPHTGVVFMDFVHSWNRMREPVQILMDKYIEFGRKNRCTVYKGTAVNEAVFRVFRKAASRRGYELDRTPLIDFLGRKK